MSDINLIMSIEDFNPDGVAVSNGNYFGMPFEAEQAQLVLVSIPWDVTVSYGGGSAKAPEAIIEASCQLDFYDEYAPDQWRKGIATASIDKSIEEASCSLRFDAKSVIDHLESGGDASDPHISELLDRVNKGSEQLNQRVYDSTLEWLNQGKLVGLVGGDHSTPYGFIKALGETHPSFGILHIDAHRDLREAYEGFEFSHASVMYNVLRDVEQVASLTQIAVRDFCQAEADLAHEDQRIHSFSDKRISDALFEGRSWASVCAEIIETLPQKVYISFDIDGLSCDNCPTTGTPVIGGLSFNQAVYLINAIVESGRSIIGFDLVEVVPNDQNPIDASVGARMLWKMCGLSLKSRD